MQTQGNGNGAKIRYHLLALKFSPPSMLHNGSIYSPHKGVDGQIKAFSCIWKAKDHNYHDLAWETRNIFNFENQMYVGCNGAGCVYAGCIGDDPRVSTKMCYFRFQLSIENILSKGNIMILQRDKVGHQDMMHKVWKIML